MDALVMPHGFFRVDANSEWGDYGIIAAHGFVYGSARDGQPLLLYRTGPFVPEVTIPNSNIVVTTSACTVLSSNFPGLRFRKVVKQHIVYSNWHVLVRRGEQF